MQRNIILWLSAETRYPMALIDCHIFRGRSIIELSHWCRVDWLMVLWVGLHGIFVRRVLTIPIAKNRRHIVGNFKHLLIFPNLLLQLIYSIDLNRYFLQYLVGFLPNRLIFIKVLHIWNRVSLSFEKVGTVLEVLGLVKLICADSTRNKWWIV